jgi:hypothetical protein
MRKYMHGVEACVSAWTCQKATGNRGDDFRALKLCDMQPYKLLHPNLETEVYCVLGLQEESKTARYEHSLLPRIRLILLSTS